MASATLIIEDAAVEGCVNIHWTCEPVLDDASQAHNLMARVLENLQELIRLEAAQNLKEASNAQNPDLAGG